MRDARVSYCASLIETELKPGLGQVNPYKSIMPTRRVIPDELRKRLVTAQGDTVI